VNVVPFRSSTEVQAAIATVAKHLESGGLLAYPTETVYGLGSRPAEADVDALAALKGRPKGKPFLLLIAGLAMAQRYGLVFNRTARALADTFWPGPLTLVLPGAEGKLPDSLRGPEGGIAVRWTSHEGMTTLITALGHPVTSTSANRPGSPPAPGVAVLVESFADVAGAESLLVLDGGVLGNVPASTLIDCTRDRPALIREGAIPRNELRARLGSLAP
jgi:L-threonylcarbamoyladenylate synthase